MKTAFIKRSGILLLILLSLMSCDKRKNPENIQVKDSGKNSPGILSSEKDSLRSNFQELEELGLKIAQSSQAELGKNLIQQLEKKGVSGALEFCHIQAIPLTDSMAVVHAAKIKRVSDKPRNPDNRANPEEVAVISTFKNQLKKGEDIKPVILESASQTDFYSPIITNAMCLMCHGKPGEELEKTNLSQIKKLYPQDQAINYEANQIRGAWHVQFKK